MFPKENKNLVWHIFHALYTILFLLLFILFLVKGINWNNITTYNRLFLTFFLICLYFPAIRGFILRYVSVPLFGLVWLVFVFRIFFIFVGGINWFYSFNIIKYGNPDLQFHRLLDLVMHFLPMLIMYQTFYVYKQEIREQVIKLNLPARIVLPYAALIGIVPWCFFVDPFENYCLPKIDYGPLVMFASIFILLSATALVRMIILTKPDRDRVYLKRIEILIGFVIIFNTIVGILLFGFENLYKSILQWCAFSVLIIIILRRIPGWHDKGSAILFIPVYSFNISITFLREFVFIRTGGSHLDFVNIAHGSSFTNSELWYSIYIFIHFSFILQTAAEILLSDFPVNLNMVSGIRSCILKQRQKMGRFSFCHRLYQVYGGLVLVALFFILNGGAGRYKFVVTRYAPLFYTVGFLFFAFMFGNAFYYEQVTLFEKLSKKKKG